MKEKKKEFLNRQDLFTKILVYLYILKIWFEKDPIYQFRYTRYEQVNKYNPLTYVAIIIAIINKLWMILWNLKSFYKDMKKFFKVQKFYS